MVLVQQWPFFKLFFLGNIGQENVFYDILERKNAFLGYKNKKLKKSKDWHFSKGVNPWFWSKNGHFSTLFFLGNISQENVFYDILELKNAFLDYKKKKNKKTKNWDFPKELTNSFGQKLALFHPFLFKQYSSGKCVLRYSRTIKTPLKPLKIKSLKYQKIHIFTKAKPMVLVKKRAIFQAFL